MTNYAECTVGDLRGSGGGYVAESKRSYIGIYGNVNLAKDWCPRCKSTAIVGINILDSGPTENVDKRSVIAKPGGRYGLCKARSVSRPIGSCRGSGGVWRYLYRSSRPPQAGYSASQAAEPRSQPTVPASRHLDARRDSNPQPPASLGPRSIHLSYVPVSRSGFSDRFLGGLQNGGFRRGQDLSRSLFEAIKSGFWCRHDADCITAVPGGLS